MSDDIEPEVVEALQLIVQTILTLERDNAATLRRAGMDGERDQRWPWARQILDNVFPEPGSGEVLIVDEALRNLCRLGVLESFTAPNEVTVRYRPVGIVRPAGRSIESTIAWLDRQ